MAKETKSRIAEVLHKKRADLLPEWLAERPGGNRRDLIRESQLKDECQEFIRLLDECLQKAASPHLDDPAFTELRQLLEGLSRTRGQHGLSPTETATFVLSFKNPLFGQLRKVHGTDAQGLADDIWAATVLLDQMAMLTIETHQKTREAVILRQQQDMLELSTPVVTLWQGILALPVIGTLDSARSQVVMESLLTRIVETGSQIAIIDITGVPTVDTLTAQHLLKTVTAARLMGADCIISGIRPQIAQTIVHLGVDLNNVTTKATLASAFSIALDRLKLAIVRNNSMGAATRG